MNYIELIKKVRRVVIKIGTGVITHSDGSLDIAQIRGLVKQISYLRNKNIQVIIVTSGAVGAGAAQLGLKFRPQGLSKLQACAAIGQSQLMHRYSEEFKNKGIITAQILLTAEDLRNRTRYLNASNTIFNLLDRKVIPIVNENDTVAVDEIKFGDNDRLSALVTHMLQAGLLIILSNIDGLYNNKGILIHNVPRITKEVEDWAGHKKSKLGTGGMLSKILAARIVSRAGEGMVIANGKKKNIIIDIFNGKAEGTFFEPAGKEIAEKKRWLAYFTKTKGSIAVDTGAYEALVNKGKSLLATGIIGVKGEFKAGDAVAIVYSEWAEFARGLVNYDNKEIMKIKGLKTSEIHRALGYKTYDEVIHRNNIVIL